MPQTYLDGLDEHEPPIPPELMQRVFRDYERRKEERGSVDFEDLLARAVELSSAMRTRSVSSRRAIGRSPSTSTRT